MCYYPSMKGVKSGDDIDELLSRGVDKIYPTRDALEKELRSGKKLRLYQGFDPTGDRLHLGHMVGLRKLAEWQALGHHVIFLIGDYTAMIGDPSGKLSARKVLTHEETLANAKNYKIQASKILKFEGNNRAEILFNGDWLGKLSAVEFFNIAGNLTYAQVIERDMFQERLKQGQDINTSEFLYPIMQAYDSVHMEVDLEVGGRDQMFNMMMGRKLMRQMIKKEKFVMTTKLLEDSKGVKIGKTEGNAIALDDKPEDLFGKIMSFPDEVINSCFESLTMIPMEEIPNKNPLEDKKRLALEIVKDLNDEEKAKSAQKHWEDTFQKKEIPDEMEEVQVGGGELLSEVLVKNKILSSKSEWRRLVEGKAIHNLLTKENITDVDLKTTEDLTLKIGKKKFIKILVESTFWIVTFIIVSKKR